MVIETPICQPTAVFHIGDVVRKVRVQKGWSQEELARRANVAKGTVNDLEQGKRNFRHESLTQVAEALETSVVDLYLALNSATGQAPPVVRELPAAEFTSNASPAEGVDVTTYRKRDIPVIGEGDASPEGTFWDPDGKPLVFVEEWMSRPDDASVRDPSCYAIVLRGDSMEPMLKRGMRLIVSPNIPVGDGDLAYVHLKSGERLVKAVQRDPNGWILESYNRDYPPRFVRRPEVESIHRVAYIRTLK